MRRYDRPIRGPEPDPYARGPVRPAYDRGYRERWGMEGLARRFWSGRGYDRPFRGHEHQSPLGGGAFWGRPERPRPRRRMRYEDTFFARAYDRFRF